MGFRDRTDQGRCFYVVFAVAVVASFLGLAAKPFLDRASKRKLAFPLSFALLLDSGFHFLADTGARPDSSLGDFNELERMCIYLAFS